MTAIALVNGIMVKLLNPAPGVYVLPGEKLPRVKFKKILPMAFFTPSKVAPQGVRQMDWGKARRLIRLGKWNLPENYHIVAIPGLTRESYFKDSLAKLSSKFC